MVYFYRLIFVFLLSFSGQALAYHWTCDVSGSSPITASDGPSCINQSVAAAIAGGWPSATFVESCGGVITNGGGTTASVVCVIKYNGNYIIERAANTYDFGTPPPPPPCPVAGTPLAGGAQSLQGSGGNFQVCFEGCVVACGGTLCIGSSVEVQTALNGWSYGFWEYTGATCSVTAPTPDAPLVQKTFCGEGLVKGIINGVETCIPGGLANKSQSADYKETFSRNPDGSITLTKTITGVACTGAACTEKTDVTTRQFSSTASTVQQEFEAGSAITAVPVSVATVNTITKAANPTYCEQNPTAAACVGIAETDITRLGELVGSGGEDLSGAALSGAAARTVLNLGTALDSSKVLGVGCVQDRSYTLYKGVVLVIPFSKMCPYLQFMGSIVLMMAFLVSARIVGVV